MNLKFFYALAILNALLGIAIVGAVIWGIIKLVMHFT
jgi:hypothetical protein